MTQTMRILTLIALFSVASFGQSLLATRYPMGLSKPNNGTSARLGGLGTGLNDGNLGMSTNPANLGNVQQSIYSLSLQGEFNKITHNDQEVNVGHFTPLQLSFGFPLGKLGTVAAAFQAVSGNNFTYSERVPLINGTTGDTVMVTLGKEVDNNTTSWELGYGNQIRKWLNLGITYQRYNYTHGATNVILNDDTLTDGTPIDIQSSMNKIEVIQGTSVLRLGVSGTINKLSYGLTGTFPFAKEAPATYSVTKISDAGDVKNPHYEDVYKGSFTLQLPPSASLGAGWELSDKLVVGADFGMTFWDAFWTSIPHDALATYSYHNTIKIVTGAEFVPAANILAPKYWETMQFGGGFRFETLPIDGDKEVALTLSLGFPLGAMGLIDFAVEGGMRRSELFSETEENFIRFTLSTGGGRQWKKKGNSVY